MPQIVIGNRKIGDGQKVFIIAEAGVNHNGSLDLALQLVDQAIKAGADAVKFQTFKAEKLVTREAQTASYQKQRAHSESQLSMLRQLELSNDDFVRIKHYADEKGIIFLSTPFDEESLDFLSELGVPAVKLGSGDLTNIPFLKQVAKTGRSIILSTGMANLGEVEQAVNTVENEGNGNIAVLHCTSEYPARYSDVNLRAIKTLQACFPYTVGYSDHTTDDTISIAAVAMGAAIIEKHFTLDTELPGPDHKASLPPPEFAAMVQKIRAVESALGDGVKRPCPAEIEMRAVARKSVVALRDIPKGTQITADMLTIKRPGTGIAPGDWERLIGKEARIDIKADTVITWDML